MNYYERHLGDYARDTAHLTLIEHGVYTLLLDRYYATEAPIPADQVHRLARARTRDERAAVDAVLSEFFQLVDVAWVNARAEREIAKYKESEPDRERKRENDKERQQRARDGRRALFDELREHGIVPPYETATPALRAMLSRVTSRVTGGDVTDPSHVITRLPDTRHQTPDTIEKKRAKAIGASTNGERAEKADPFTTDLGDDDDPLPDAQDRKGLACPAQQIADLWGEVLPELRAPAVWNRARHTAVRSRWREMAAHYDWTEQQQGLEWFRRLMVKIRESAFLMGKAPPTRDKEPFQLTFDWLFRPTNFVKVIEGTYNRGR